MKIFVCLLFCLAGGLLAWKIYPLIYDFCNRTKYYNCYISKAKIVRKRYQEAVTSNYKKRLQYHPEVAHDNKPFKWLIDKAYNRYKK